MEQFPKNLPRTHEIMRAIFDLDDEADWIDWVLARETKMGFRRDELDVVVVNETDVLYLSPDKNPPFNEGSVALFRENELTEKTETLLWITNGSVPVV